MQFFFVSNSSEAEKGAAKIAVCKFCEKTKPSVVAVLPQQLPTFWPVFGQTKAGIQSCILINIKDDDRRAILKNTQLKLSEVRRRCR